MPDYEARCRVLEDELGVAKERIRALEAELGVTSEPPLGLGLTGSEARVFGVLMARPMATQSALLAVLYGDRIAEDDVPDQKIVNVFVCKMRAKLTPFGIEIETVWGQGWRLSAETKAMVRELA